jgi:pimeloyl-[acyl-carrier protein] synthase
MTAPPSQSPDADLFGPAMLADPYAAYARLRAADPVHWDAPMGAWLLTRYADVDAALRDARLSNTFGTALPSAAQAAGGRTAAGWATLESIYTFVQNSLVFTDPPRHTRLRELVSKAFTPQTIDPMRPHIQSLLDGLLDPLVARGRFDLAHDLAYPFPLAVLALLLGFPQEDRDQIKRWCDEFLVPFGRDPATLPAADVARARESGDALSRYVRDLVAQARAHSRADLLSALVQAESAGERLTEDELFANVVLFLIAGHENLTGLLGCGALALLQQPDQWQRLRGDPALVSGAVEELARYVTPNQFIRRVALQDLTIGDKAVQKDQVVLLVLAAANRDPARYPDPDRLDVGRAVGWPLAFGHGFHFCLGVALARLEGEIFFGTLIQRCPSLTLATEQVQYVDNFNVRQVQALPVTV